MPAILVNDYTWRQTTEMIVIMTRLAGHPKKIDLFAVDNYVKASYPPFILELFLWGTIDEESSQCTIGEETAVFTLKKREIGVEWPSLLMEDLDKEKKRAQRSRALEIARVSTEERAKARSEKRQAMQRQAVREQIDLDTEELNRIQALKDSHRREAMEEFEDWRKRAEKPILENLPGIIQENRKAFRAPLKWFKDDRQTSIIEGNDTKLEMGSSESERVQEPKEHGKEEGENRMHKNTSSVQGNVTVDNINCLANEDEKTKDESTKLLAARKCRDVNKVLATSTSSSDSSSSQNDSDQSEKSPEKLNEKARRKLCRRKKRETANRGRELARRVLSEEKSGFRSQRRPGIFDENDTAIPRPRRTATIDVKFTERQFPTPARESHRLEEEEWLLKQAEARRKSGFVSEDLRTEEQDPQWLKNKGDEFFKIGNYLGAISAYTHGIKLSGKMSSLYVNRSAAHYAAENYRRCAEDCSTALELMTPKCEGNRESRARCHARLGAALCKLSSPQHGIPELEAALKLAPENETIKRDLQVARRYFEIKD